MYQFYEHSIRPYFKTVYSGTSLNNIWASFEKHTSTMSALFVGIGVPAALGIWIFAEEAMALFGPGFVEGVWAMRIYVLGVVVMLIFGPASAALSLCGQEGRASRIMVAALVVQIGLNLVLIPAFGPVGCACSNLVGLTILAFVSRLSVRRHIGIEPSILSVFRSRL